MSVSLDRPWAAEPSDIAGLTQPYLDEVTADIVDRTLGLERLEELFGAGLQNREHRLEMQMLLMSALANKRAVPEGEKNVHDSGR